MKVVFFSIVNILFVVADYSKGFGGKYGVQKDHVDKSAVGWDHHEKLEQHESQKGKILRHFQLRNYNIFNQQTNVNS